jgi:hypothetical protein
MHNKSNHEVLAHLKSWNEMIYIKITATLLTFSS